VYDQDFTMQTANSVFDITVGLSPAGQTVASAQTGVDASGKELFPSSSLMMREKMDIYRQFAQTLLGDSTLKFRAAFDSNSSSDDIDTAMFISFKRLFARDSIKRESFAMRFFQTASVGDGAGAIPNLQTAGIGQAIYTDIGASTNKLSTFGGQLGNIVDASNTGRTVGLMFYDRGVAVFDLSKIISGSQYVNGQIDAMNSIGRMTIGAPGTQTPQATFIPDFVVSGSIDNIVDHLGYSRFGSNSNTAITFQNITNINSTLIFCRLSADEFNYSSNPTFTDANNRIVVIDQGQEDTQQSFVFITSIGLYDANDNLLAVGKLSRPVMKSNERDLTTRLRLDFLTKKRFHIV
jgi:hypothetical protein